jgi:hypothetical protein
MREPAACSINYKQLVFRLIAKEPLVLPAYKGSTLRGGFGYAFRRINCATPVIQTDSITLEFIYEC